jgi:UDP-2,3-diacylglucosamine pyrophosphatase LpxH
MKVKSLFISDIHIGCGGNNIDKVLDILDDYEFENLFLLGDIIDGWRLSVKWKWKKSYTKFFKKLIKLRDEGVKIIYITGNHDEFLRPVTPINIGLCDIYDEYVYGNKLLIHGDRFDTLIYKKKWLYFLGDRAYNLLITLDWLFGLKGRLSKRVKHIVKAKINYLNDFYSVAAKYAKFKKCDTVICGHTHIQEYQLVDDVEYYNCGDMRECCHFLIEDLSGKLILRSSDE